VLRVLVGLATTTYTSKKDRMRRTEIGAVTLATSSWRETSDAAAVKAVA
jgi:hypothetical protein